MEAETSLKLSRMGFLVNGDVSAETSRKRLLENSSDIYSSVSVKYKRRKISATRDFPKGCGRFAPRVNGVQDCVPNGNEVEESKVNPQGSPIVETDLKTSGVAEGPSKTPEILVESETLNFSKTLVKVESPYLLNPSDSANDKPSKSPDQVEVLEPINVEPLAVESPKDLDEKESLKLSKTIEPTTMDSLKNLNETELLNSAKSSEKPLLEDGLEREGQPEKMDVPSSSNAQSPRVSVQPPTLEVSKSSDQAQPSIPVIETEEKMPKKYPPPRRISAFRDFPPCCGRNTPRVSKQECLKSLSSSKKLSLGDRKPSVEAAIGDAKQVREKSRDEDALKGDLKENVGKEFLEEVRVKTASERKLKVVGSKQISSRPPVKSNFSRSESKSELIGKKIDRDVKSLEGKRGKESINKENSLKRKLSENEYGSGAINQAQEESIGFENFDDWVIVQGLMAAPFCPWKQGKLIIRSDFANSSAKNKVKDSVVEHNRDKPVSKKRDRKDISEEKLTKKKTSSSGKAAYEGTNRPDFFDDKDSEEPNEENRVQRSQKLDLSVIPFGLHTSNDKNDSGNTVTRNKVRETLRLFQAISRKLLQEEEGKSKEQETTRRIDLQAGNILKEKNKWVNTGKPILGPVPGVEVGDEFHYRVELAIVGLHRPFQGGIDYVKKGGKVLATSIVASGGYADDMDNSDVLVYSGQGGNPGGADKKAEDQKLERGNLSLKNSMDSNSPVRVIRGSKETKTSESVGVKGKTVVTYVYDGLYMVENFWQEQGRYGTSVFKFQLRRIPGQPELAWKEVKNSKKSKERKGLCVSDISQGKENKPICAINTIDDEKPAEFNYTTTVMYPDWYDPSPPKGCDCTDGCSDSEKCLCAVKNGGEIPFNHNGAIVEAKTIVYECGPSCKCASSCHNRVSQHGIKFQLEIFKTQSRGWGVRSLISIPSGSFICEYTGELLKDKEAEQRTGNDEYLFDIGHNYSDHSLWDGLSTLMPTFQPNLSEVSEDVGFTIDALNYGNVGRFINHSCSPNLYAQDVLYDHDDKRMPHVMFFAAENIPPLQELTYHYNYKIDQVRDSDGNIKKKDCYCGSHDCTGRMY